MSVLPTQLLIFVLQSHPYWDGPLCSALESLGGTLRHRGDWFPFDRTEYYQPEMGGSLFRSVASFERLIDPAEITSYKKKSMKAEKEFLRPEGGRQFNLDVGYMDPDKVVLPSCKMGPWKIYSGDDIWLDMVMHYSKGSFSGTPWTFEDFIRNPYQRDLQLIRERYKKALKAPALKLPQD